MASAPARRRKWRNAHDAFRLIRSLRATVLPDGCGVEGRRAEPVDGLWGASGGDPKPARPPMPSGSPGRISSVRASTGPPHVDWQPCVHVRLCMAHSLVRAIPQQTYSSQKRVRCVWPAASVQTVSSNTQSIAPQARSNPTPARSNFPTPTRHGRIAMFIFESSQIGRLACTGNTKRRHHHISSAPMSPIRTFWLQLMPRGPQNRQ